MEKEQEVVVATDVAPSPARRPRGFACLSAERRKEISSKGGISAHKLGVAHHFTKEEARAAGKKGGVAYHATRGRSLPKETPVVEE